MCEMIVGFLPVNLSGLIVYNGLSSSYELLVASKKEEEEREKNRSFPVFYQWL